MRVCCMKWQIMTSLMIPACRLIVEGHQAYGQLRDGLS